MSINKENYVATCETKYIRCNTFKLRKVADVVRHMEAKHALQVLKRMPQTAAGHLYKALHSAVYNAFNTQQIDSQDLVVELLLVNQGRKLRRFKARARGRSNSIDKPTSHIVVGLNKKDGSK